MTYTVKPDAAEHACWADPQWDGCMAAPSECAGCNEAAEYPCRFCGYGHIFTTHNDLAHYENGDLDTPPEPAVDEWHDSPHIYQEVERK